jgi:hypothetical protein
VQLMFLFAVGLLGAPCAILVCELTCVCWCIRLSVPHECSHFAPAYERSSSSHSCLLNSSAALSASCHVGVTRSPFRACFTTHPCSPRRTITAATVTQTQSRGNRCATAVSQPILARSRAVGDESGRDRPQTLSARCSIRLAKCCLCTRSRWLECNGSGEPCRARSSRSGCRTGAHRCIQSYPAAAQHCIAVVIRSASTSTTVVTCVASRSVHT